MKPVSLHNWALIDCGALVSMLCLTLALHRGTHLLVPLEQVEFNSLLGAGMVFGICTLLLYRPTFLAGFHTMAHSLPMALSGFGILILLIVLFRIDYSRSVLLLSCTLTMLWFPLRVRLIALYSTPYFYLVPGGRPLELQNLKRLHCTTLQEPELPGKCDGIIADLQTELPEQWSHFLAEATLKQVPVYDASIVYEASSGRLPLDHLSNNRLGMLLPSTVYILWKRIFDAMV